MEEDNIKEKIQEIRETITANKLVMNRVPANTLKRFHDIANEEDFCEDYGMVLKHLIDFYDGVLGDGNEHLELAIQDLQFRMSTLEQNSPHNQIEARSNTKTMADGTTIKTKKVA